MLRQVALAVVASGGTAVAGDTELDRATIVYARGAAIYKNDGKGKAEAELVPLANATTTVRALHGDARGKVLLAELSSGWWWMPLDGKALVALPQCHEGPARLDPDGECVLCRGASGGVIVNLASGRSTPVEAPATAHIVGSGAQRKLVWPDASGIWSAPLADPKRKTRVAPEPPLRAFVPSHDGARAVAVYPSFVHEGRQQRPADALMSFALDGEAARRKTIRGGIPLEWSHDNQWVLVQEGPAACLMRANGGQYKCWKGFTAVSIAPDGSYALVLGSRDGKSAPAPNGPLALYRARLDGVYDAPPQLVVRIVDGPAVWIRQSGT